MHPNAQAVLRGFQAFAQGDMATMKGLFADDATWHFAGRNKWSGDYTGSESIVDNMSGVAREATVDNQPHAVLADDDHVVVLIKASWSRNGRSFEANTVYVFHVSDEKITEAWAIPATGTDKTNSGLTDVPVTALRRPCECRCLSRTRLDPEPRHCAICR